jgi:hypothetical protein
LAGDFCRDLEPATPRRRWQPASWLFAGGDRGDVDSGTNGRQSGGMAGQNGGETVIETEGGKTLLLMDEEFLELARNLTPQDFQALVLDSMKTLLF